MRTLILNKFLHRNGGSETYIFKLGEALEQHGHELYSISRWTAEDGRKLKHFLEVEFEEKQNRQIYWDDVAMFCHSHDFKLGMLWVAGASGRL